jgi:hypothetical protein
MAIENHWAAGFLVILRNPAFLWRGECTSFHSCLQTSSSSDAMKRAWAEPKENNCDAAQLCTRGNPDALVRSESTQKKTRSFVPGYGELATCFSVQNLNVQLRSIVFVQVLQAV